MDDHGDTVRENIHFSTVCHDDDVLGTVLGSKSSFYAKACTQQCQQLSTDTPSPALKGMHSPVFTTQCRHAITCFASRLVFHSMTRNITPAHLPFEDHRTHFGNVSFTLLPATNIDFVQSLHRHPKRRVGLTFHNPSTEAKTPSACTAAYRGLTISRNAKVARCGSANRHLARTDAH